MAAWDAGLVETDPLHGMSLTQLGPVLRGQLKIANIHDFRRPIVQSAMRTSGFPVLGSTHGGISLLSLPHLSLHVTR